MKQRSERARAGNEMNSRIAIARAQLIKSLELEESLLIPTSERI